MENETTYCGGCKKEEEMYRPIDMHWWARKDAYVELQKKESK